MTRARRLELRRQARFWASAQIQNFVDAGSPAFDEYTEEEALAIEAELRLIIARLVRTS